MKLKVEGINLLPDEYIQAQKEKNYLLVAIILLILECSIFVFHVIVPPLNTIKAQNIIINQLELQMREAKYADVNQTIQNLQSKQVDIQQWVDQYERIKAPSFISAELFDELLSRVPQGIKIDALQITPGQEMDKNWEISVQGTTRDNQAVYNYVTLLETIYKGCKISWTLSEPNTENLYQTYHIALVIQRAQLTAEKVSEEVASASSEAHATIEGGLQQ